MKDKDKSNDDPFATLEEDLDALARWFQEGENSKRFIEGLNLYVIQTEEEYLAFLRESVIDSSIVIF